MNNDLGMTLTYFPAKLGLIILVYNFAASGGSGVRLYDGPDLKLFILVG